jgi:hypothetical protein
VEEAKNAIYDGSWQGRETSNAEYMKFRYKIQTVRDSMIIHLMIKFCLKSSDAITLKKKALRIISIWLVLLLGCAQLRAQQRGSNICHIVIDDHAIPIFGNLGNAKNMIPLHQDVNYIDESKLTYYYVAVDTRHISFWDKFETSTSSFDNEFKQLLFAHYTAGDEFLIISDVLGDQGIAFKIDELDFVLENATENDFFQRQDYIIANVNLRRMLLIHHSGYLFQLDCYSGG